MDMIESPKPKRKYNFLSAQDRAAHPIITGFVANAVAGPNAFGLLHALDREEKDRLMMGQRSQERRFETGRALALKIGSADVLEPDDPLYERFQRAFTTLGNVPEGYNLFRGQLVRKPTRPQPRAIAGEGGIYSVEPTPGGGLGARRIPILGSEAEPSPTPTPSRARPAVPPAPQPGAGLPSVQPGHAPTYLMPKPAAPKGSGGGGKQLKRIGDRMFWVDPKTQEMEPVIDPTTGNPARPGTPANLAGIQQQLDNVARLMREMKSNYRAGPKSTGRRALGTASANILGGEIGGSLGLSGVASGIDPHAVIHERDRAAAATALAFPLTGSRRSMEGARQSLMQVIPHYSDPPNVWDVFDRQMTDLVATARRMPWGDDPEGSAEAYGNGIDAAVTAMNEAKAATPAPASAPAGADLRRKAQEEWQAYQAKKAAGGR